jgi:hypothetical protein
VIEGLPLPPIFFGAPGRRARHDAGGRGGANESLVTVALFSGIGLLLSLSVLILDQYIPGESEFRPREMKNPPA